MVGRRFSEERARLGLTQISLAEQLDLTREQIGKYERGINWPGGEVLFSLAQRGADVLYIVTGERKNVAPGSFRADVLRQVVEGVEEDLQARRQRLPPTKKAELIALLYEQFSKAGQTDKQAIGRFLRLVA